MKRIIAFVLAAAFMLSGCAGKEEPTQKGSESAGPPVNPLISSQEIISPLNARLEKNGYPTLDGALRSELTTTVDDTSYTCALYVPSSGMSLYFLTAPEDGSLHQFAFYANHDEISAPAGQLEGYINSSLPFFFEPDTWESLISDLGIGGTAGETRAPVTGDIYEYTYENGDQASVFSVCAVGEEPIDFRSLDFSAGSITPQEIDWTIPRFVSEFDAYAATAEMTLLADTKPVPLGESDLEGLALEVAVSEGVSYTPERGVQLYLYASESGRVELIELLLSVSDVESPGLKWYIYALTQAVFMMDHAHASDILDTLKISDLDNTGRRTTVGGQMFYIYTVENAGLIALITRNSPVVTLGGEPTPAAEMAPEAETTPETNPAPAANLDSEAKTASEVEPAAPSDKPAENSAPAAEKPAPKNDYTSGSPRFEGWLCESLDVLSDPDTVRPVNSKTTFKSGDYIYLAGRYYGWTGEETLTLMWLYPDDTYREDKFYYATAGSQESSGTSHECAVPGEGSLTITMDSTGQTLAVLPFTIVE